MEVGELMAEGATMVLVENVDVSLGSQVAMRSQSGDRGSRRQEVSNKVLKVPVL